VLKVGQNWVLTMGVTPVEKAKLAAYQLKGVAQIWFNQWKEARSEKAGPIEWETFKSASLDIFFPLEMRQGKVLEFFNLQQGNMSVREYALRFTQLSKYAPSIVIDRRTKMSKFVSGVSDLVVKECCTAMLVHDMDISHLTVLSQQFEEEELKERSREAKRERVDDGNYSYSRFSGWGRSRFRQKFSGQGSSNAPPRPKNERVSNPKAQEDSGKSSMTTCAKCGKTMRVSA